MSHITRPYLKAIMASIDAEMAANPDPDEPYVSFTTRSLLSDECRALHSWLISLSHHQMSPEDQKMALNDIYISRRVEVILPASMKKDLMLAKLTWG